ncbi:MAG: S8 family peptidase [Woeseiaceae bacterium]
MKARLIIFLLALTACFETEALAEDSASERQILVTYENSGARPSGAGTPYRHRKRYSISVEARRFSSQIVHEYGLTQVDHWPIKHLSIYCFVYRIADGDSRDAVLEKLRADSRVESAQAMREFETGLDAGASYDDTYAGLQHGLATLDVSMAHRYSRGSGIRIAVIDSNADVNHEDLKGRIDRVKKFPAKNGTPDHKHGTAVTSIIGAVANNAKGIIGIAPESSVELFVACWSQGHAKSAICNSFVLAKALDNMLDKPPNVLNLSLTGPDDELVARLLRRAHSLGVIIVAARSTIDGNSHHFPASMQEVIGVGISESPQGDQTKNAMPADCVYAPGEKILVALPDNAYDFRSGSSLAAAHVSGVVALLLDISPDAGFDKVRSILERSQRTDSNSAISVNACKALQLVDSSLDCDA